MESVDEQKIHRQIISCCSA